MARDPSDDIRGELREYFQICLDLVQDVATLKANMRIVMWALAVVGGGIIVAIIGWLSKGH
ncbi:hypothetical protein [Glutamicibacter sp.]|jgi:hypothetical protein|uniref:hypothetical protein n=1 Tax=Glutamicibacter sp. TaxID=1931995 RepID=UPI002FDA6C14